MIVAHDAVNRVLLCRVLGLPLERVWTFRQAPAALNVLAGDALDRCRSFGSTTPSTARRCSAVGTSRAMTPTLSAIIARDLALQGDLERALGSKAYLKSDLDFIGVTAPVQRKTVLAAERARPFETRRELFATVNELWSRRVFELKAAAVELLMHRDDLVVAQSLPALRVLIASSHTWALVDPLSTTVIGTLYEHDATIAKTLDAWAKHDDFWVRRAAMLAHLKGLRRGAGDFTRFSRYADAMLDEREFFIRKAIGWVLRETSKKRPELVADWLQPRVTRASGVTFREAVKYLPTTRKRALLKARSSARSASG